MTLYVSLNDSRELVLESDHNGQRETLIEDTDGPTEWTFDPALEVPERTNHLVREWVKDVLSSQQLSTSAILSVMLDFITQNIVDDR
jgi:hypothetical protein